MAWKKRWKRKSSLIYKKKGTKRPSYQGELPKGNNGLGLLLLGFTGDQVLPAEVYEKIKAETICKVQGNSAGRYPKRGPGTEYLYFFNGFCSENDGGYPGIFHRS